MKIATIAAIAANSLVIASGASAATMFGSSGTTLSLTPLANQTQQFFVTGATADGGDYYYTFTTTDRYAVNFTDSGSLNANVVENDFIVTAGSTPNAGPTVAASTFGTYGSGVTTTLAAGTYTLYVGSTQDGQALDGTVSVAAVPEPAAWALMIVGFAGIGGAMRRRSTVAPVSVA